MRGCRACVPTLRACQRSSRTASQGWSFRRMIPRALRQAIRWMLEHPDERASMGARADAGDGTSIGHRVSPLPGGLRGMSILQRAARGVAGVLGEDSVFVRTALVPCTSRRSRFGGSSGIPWTINGAEFRISLPASPHGRGLRRGGRAVSCRPREARLDHSSWSERRRVRAAVRALDGTRGTCCGL